MIDVINLALPFFGLIFIGFACGKLKRIPDTALAWMNFFIIYVALPALFFRILTRTPLAQLAQVNFILATTLSTFWAFAVSFAIVMAVRRGPDAAVPVALIFCFDTLLLFSLVPFLMAFASPQPLSFVDIARDVSKRIVLNPLVIATAVGILSAAIKFEPPVGLARLLDFLQNAAAPCALFTLGVTVALRPLKRLPWEVPLLIPVKLVVHPVILFVLLSMLGSFDETWVYTAILMASLPPALNVYVFARQYDTWVEQASSAVLFGTLASVATLTAVMWLAKTHNLPPLLFR